MLVVLVTFGSLLDWLCGFLQEENFFWGTTTCIKLSHLFCTIYSISKVWCCLIFFPSFWAYFETICALLWGMSGVQNYVWSYSFIHITSVNPLEPFCAYCYIFRMNNTVDFKKCDGPSEWMSEWVKKWLLERLSPLKHTATSALL